MTGVMRKGPLTSDVTILRKRRQSSWTWNVKIAATSTRKYFCRLRSFNNMGKRTYFLTDYQHDKLASAYIWEGIIMDFQVKI